MLFLPVGPAQDNGCFTSTVPATLTTTSGGCNRTYLAFRCDLSVGWLWSPGRLSRPETFSRVEELWSVHRNKEAILEEHRREVLQAANVAKDWDIQVHLRALDAEVARTVSIRSLAALAFPHLGESLSMSRNGLLARVYETCIVANLTM